MLAFVQESSDMNREIRNDVMHFGPDPLSPSQKKSLEQMESFLKHVFE